MNKINELNFPIQQQLCETKKSFYKSLTNSLTVNKVASALIVGSFLGGAAFAIMNPDPLTKTYDIATGSAIAFSLSTVISTVTTVIQGLRNKPKEASLWALGAAVSFGMSTPRTHKESDHEILAASSKNQRIARAEECQSDNTEPSNVRINRLSCNLLEQAKHFIDEGKIKDSPMSLTGHAYFPKNIQVVIKDQNSLELVEKMEQARRLCHVNGYSHLAIAQSSLYKEYILQSLLPIPPHNDKLQIGLYLEHREVFSDAIREFTGFLCQAKLEDLDNRFAHTNYNSLSKGLVPRFDNAVLYLEKSDAGLKGKIALADLDYFESIKEGTDLSHQVKTAILLFPHHFEEILEEARKFYPKIDEQRTSLEKVRDQVLDFHENIYGCHLKFIHTHEITPSEPAAPLQITQEKKSELIKNLTKFLNQVRKANFYSNTRQIILSSWYLPSSKYEKALQKMVDEIEAFISESLRKKHSNLHLPIETTEQLVAFRTLILDKSPLYKELVAKIATLTNTETVAKELLKLAFEQMNELEIIANYNREMPQALFC